MNKMEKQKNFFLKTFQTKKSAKNLKKFFGMKSCFLAMSLAIIFSSCSQMFENKIPMTSRFSSSSEMSTLNSIFVEEVPIDTLSQPSYIYVSRYDYNDTIKVSWASVRGATSYRLERAIVPKSSVTNDEFTPEEEEFEVIEHASQLYDCNYTDKIITDSANDILDYENKKFSMAYFYRVSAENKRMGYNSSEFKVSQKGTLLPSPTGLSASLGVSEEYIELKWNETEGAKSYEIYRTFNSDGSNSSRIGTAYRGREVFRDEKAEAFSGENLYYVVRAISQNNEKSVQSSVAMGYTLVHGAPPQVQNVKVSTGRGNVASQDGISITWDKSEDENIKYAVYRSSSSDSTLSKLKDGLSNEENSYKDTRNLKPSTYYYYYVQAYIVDSEGVVIKGTMSNSGPDAIDDATKKSAAAEGFVLSPPLSLSVVKDKNDSSKCAITFSAAIGDENYLYDSKKYNDYAITAENYVVLASDSENGTFNQITLSSPSAKDGYYSATVPAQKFYKMRVVNDDKQSIETEVVAPAPYAAQNVYVTRAAFIGEMSEYQITGTEQSQMKTETGANANGVHPVKITWEAPEDGAEGGYYIYRSAKIDSGFRRVNDNPVGKDTVSNKFSYIDGTNDNTIKAGTIYYYKVLSLNSLGQGANYSEVDNPADFLVDIINSSGENVNAKWPKGTKSPTHYKGGPYPLHENKARRLPVSTDVQGENYSAYKGSENKGYGRGFGWGALSMYQFLQEQRKTVVSSQAKLTIMHKSSNMDKVGTETTYGDISGQLYYDSSVDLGSLSGVVTMPYTDYADSFISGDANLGVYFFFDHGNTNTKANISANGSMNGTIVCYGMYPGKVRYDKVGISGGNAASGTYGVIREGIETDFKEIHWKAAN